MDRRHQSAASHVPRQVCCAHLASTRLWMRQTTHTCAGVRIPGAIAGYGAAHINTVSEITGVHLPSLLYSALPGVGCLAWTGFVRHVSCVVSNAVSSRRVDCWPSFWPWRSLGAPPAAVHQVVEE